MVWLYNKALQAEKSLKWCDGVFVAFAPLCEA